MNETSRTAQHYTEQSVPYVRAASIFPPSVCPSVVKQLKYITAPPPLPGPEPAASSQLSSLWSGRTDLGVRRQKRRPTGRPAPLLGYRTVRSDYSSKLWLYST